MQKMQKLLLSIMVLGLAFGIYSCSKKRVSTDVSKKEYSGVNTTNQQVSLEPNSIFDFGTEANNRLEEIVQELKNLEKAGATPQELDVHAEKLLKQPIPRSWSFLDGALDWVYDQETYILYRLNS